ncbi:MAG: YIP1 family protein [Yoonia sp.]
MSVTNDILRSWRAPREVMAKLLSMGQREDRALAHLMAACIIIFVAQWPRLSRIAAGFEGTGGDTPELTQLMAYEFLGWLMVWPLMFYALAAVAHIIAKIFRGTGTWYTARLALFWSLLATTPVALLYGLCAGLIGPAASTSLVGVIWIAAFFFIFIMSMIEAEKA